MEPPKEKSGNEMMEYQVHMDTSMAEASHDESANSPFGHDERYQFLLKASSQVLYRMSPDWSEMRHLGGGGFLSDTEAGNRDWLRDYIPEEERALVRKRITEAVGSRTVFELEHRVTRMDGSIGWALSRAVPLFAPDGELVEWFGAASDITDRKESEAALRAALAEREVLLKEVHHRVKNNLQVITSLLEMQARQMANTQATSAFGEARNRVSSIAAIHDYLYRSHSLNEIDLAVYSRDLAKHLMMFYRAGQQLKTCVSGAIMLDLDRGVSFGLLLNELISNVCRHAFPNDQSGELTICLSEEDRTIRALVTDTGVGLPPDFKARSESSLGVSLVRALVEQMKGTVQFRSNAGTQVEVCIPRP